MMETHIIRPGGGLSRDDKEMELMIGKMPAAHVKIDIKFARIFFLWFRFYILGSFARVIVL